MLMIDGAVILLAGILIGRYLPCRRQARKQPEPVCGCGHHHAYHDPAAGTCSHTYRLITYQGGGSTHYGETQHCPCRQYSGPVPLPDVYAPEISS